MEDSLCLFSDLSAEFDASGVRAQLHRDESNGDGDRASNNLRFHAMTTMNLKLVRISYNDWGSMSCQLNRFVFLTVMSTTGLFENVRAKVRRISGGVLSPPTSDMTAVGVVGRVLISSPYHVFVGGGVILRLILKSNLFGCSSTFKKWSMWRLLNDRNAGLVVPTQSDSSSSGPGV